MLRKIALGAAMCALLAGCAEKYTLVPAAATPVARNAMTVTPSVAWNRIPRSPSDIAEEENWTANGPLLDTISFVGGLADGRPVVKQRRRASQQVPVFRGDMSPQDLVSMLESYHRIRDEVTLFETTGVQPTTFLGSPGTRFDYQYVGADQLRRRGRAVMAIVEGRLYMIVLTAARSHYFDAALPELDRMTSGAERRVRRSS